MRIHFIINNEPFIQQFAMALTKENNVSVSSYGVLSEDLSASGIAYRGEEPEKINSEIEAVVLSENIKKDHLEWERARSLNLPIYTYSDFLYQQSKMKTRVVVAGGEDRNTVIAMVLHTMEYHNRVVDIFLEKPINGYPLCKLSKEAEFILIEGNDSENSTSGAPILLSYMPTLALITNLSSGEKEQKTFADFINTLTKGGIILYNQEDASLSDLVEKSENQLRKIPYQTAEHQENNGQTFLITPEGEMPLNFSEVRMLSNLSGAKWLCQNMGIDEQDFYEAIATFHQS